MTTERRYDIDWLRVIAIGLLLIYHVAIVFQPWGALIGFIQSENPMESIWKPMTMLNVWRIPLLFYVSGMGVCFAMRKRNFKQLLFERAKRILVPFMFGSFVIVPVHVYLWQKYYYQDIIYSPHPGHLWFLGNIFVYVIILVPVFFYLRNNKTLFLNRWLNKLYSNPISILAIGFPFILETLIVKPESFEVYAMTMHGFVIGLLAFFFGFTFILNGKVFWQTILKWKWLYFATAGLLYGIRLLYFRLNAPNYFVAIESVMWVISILGIAYRYLNKPSKVLTYLKQGAYPIYILHMIFIYLGATLILPLRIENGLKFFLLTVFTFLGSILTYILIVRIRFLRAVFGI